MRENPQHFTDNEWLSNEARWFLMVNVFKIGSHSLFVFCFPAGV